MFGNKRLKAEIVRLSYRVAELEERLCPCEQHDWKRTGVDYSYDGAGCCDARTDPADICREMHMDADFLSRCKRKLRRERKRDDYLKMQEGVI